MVKPGQRLKDKQANNLDQKIKSSNENQNMSFIIDNQIFANLLQYADPATR